MKTSPLLFSLGALALSCSLFTACGDDEADDSGTGGSTSMAGSNSMAGSSGTGGGSSSGGSGSGGSENGPCPYPVIATWTEGGEEHHASTVFASIIGGDVFNFNAVACEDDEQVVFKFLPFPLVPDTYELRYHRLGETGPVEPAANYSSEVDGAYATNADHTGELVITEFDEDAKTFSGTFHFEAVDYAGGDDTVTVTDGTLTNVSFK